MEDEKTQEPTCKSCGTTGWKPPTRREFLQGTVTAGLGLAMGAAMLSSPTIAHAGSFPKCEDEYNNCVNNCFADHPNSSFFPEDEEDLASCTRGCLWNYQVCVGEELLRRLEELLRQVLEYLLAHPWLIVLGAIIIIGGVAFVIIGIVAGLIPIIAVQ